jgi:hypothetical protein
VDIGVGGWYLREEVGEAVGTGMGESVIEKMRYLNEG